MTAPRPGILPVRAVNQYRRRDVLPYLALRYYLANTAARSDQWVRNAAIRLFLTRSDRAYFCGFHFKDIDPQGKIEHRRVFLPGANEALAEAALLAECAALPDAFANPPCVFSYELSRGEDRRGVFQPYFGGFQRRHQAIAEACDACPDGIVYYADIQRFYPSIRGDLALIAWRKQADAGQLSSGYRDLGERILQDHREVEGSDGNGILTGPMFSHLLGNLVLRELDNTCSRDLPARYFRYVDDIALVGTPHAVMTSLAILNDRLGELGLQLHDGSSPKSMTIPTQQWLEGRNDFRESRRPISWKTLIGDLKQFLLRNPGECENLRRECRNEGLRIPFLDYAGAIHETSYLEKLKRWARQPWFRRKIREISIPSLLRQAKWLRMAYDRELCELMAEVETKQGYGRKRRIPMLRYRAGRLICLATDDRLFSLSSLAAEVPELRLHAEVMSAVATGKIDRLLPLGANAAQAAAQSLRAAERRAALASARLGVAEEQALAVFFLNGVPVDRPNPEPGQGSELMRFASVGVDLALMKSGDPYLRELACLHGLSNVPRHPDVLVTAFDEDEVLIMDAIDQLDQYWPY